MTTDIKAGKCKTFFNQQSEIDKLEARVTKAEAERDEQKAALTPSAETKAAYMGEFQFGFPSFDWDGKEVRAIVRSTTVPWTTIKEIMKAISYRAALRQSTKGGGEV